MENIFRFVFTTPTSLAKVSRALTARLVLSKTDELMRYFSSRRPAASSDERESERDARAREREKHARERERETRVTLLVASRLAGRRDRRFRPTDREFRIVLASSHRLDARLGDDVTTTRALEEDVEDARERRRVQR